METAQYKFHVTGRVQGVGYRYFVLEWARKYELSGYVRNQSDGSVLCVAVGVKEKIHDLERQLRCGPVGARVEHVSKEVSLSSVGHGFRIV